MLQFKSVARTYREGQLDVHALGGVDLEVSRGELVAVMGPSGSGKSTLLQLAGGLDVASRGSILIEGVGDITELSKRELALLRRRHVGYVFQDYNLLPSLTALENVALPLELDGVSSRQLAQAAGDALESVGLAELGARYPDQLSGGERQRVAVARGLIGRKHLLLADEPTGAVDSVTASQILELIKRKTHNGAAALVVTHDPAVARWADRVIRLRDGLLDLTSSVMPRTPPTEVSR